MEEKLLKLIQVMEKRIDRLESEVLNIKNLKKISKAAGVKNITNKTKKKEGPAKWIEDFAISGFFDTYKSAIDVSIEFRKQVLSADMPTIRKQLARAVTKKLLVRDRGGTINNPWKYKKR